MKTRFITNLLLQSLLAPRKFSSFSGNSSECSKLSHSPISHWLFQATDNSFSIFKLPLPLPTFMRRSDPISSYLGTPSPSWFAFSDDVLVGISILSSFHGQSCSSYTGVWCPLLHSASHSAFCLAPTFFYLLDSSEFLNAQVSPLNKAITPPITPHSALTIYFPS